MYFLFKFQVLENWYGGISHSQDICQAISLPLLNISPHAGGLEMITNNVTEEGENNLMFPFN